jgi:hypothetical protein
MGCAGFRRGVVAATALLVGLAAQPEAAGSSNEFPLWSGPGSASTPRANDQLTLRHHSTRHPSAAAATPLASKEGVISRLAATAQVILHAGPPRPNGENRLVAAAPPSDTGRCRTIMLTGDSNLRDVFHLLAESFELAGHVRRYRYPTEEQIKLPCSPSDPSVDCEPRWADQTWIYAASAASTSCTVALLFRFMNNQGALTRAATNPLETLLCNARSLGKQTPVCRDARRLQLDPAASAMLVDARFSVAWHAHGVWGLDEPPWFNAAASAADGSAFDCATRFSSDIADLHALAKRGAQVIWQSNFPVVAHPVVTNEFLRKDVECQRLQAAQENIAMADLPGWGLAAGTANADGPAEWTASKRQAGGWHLNAHGRRVVAAAVLEAVRIVGDD